MKFFSFSLSDAILQAEEHFKCKQDKLKVTTIKSPRKRMFGIKKIQGEYEIEVIPDPVESTIMNEEIKNEDIFEELISEKFTEPTSIVAPESECEENLGEKITDPPIMQIKAKLSADKMQAILTINRVHGREYTSIDDIAITEVDAKNTKNTSSNKGYKVIPAPTPTLEECLDSLEQLGVVSELIDTDKINELLKLEGSNSITVANGIPPVNGTDSKIDLKFVRDNYRNPDFNTGKRVSLMDHTIIPDVKAGDVLAIKSAYATMGVDGKTVTGSAIKAKRGIDIPLKIGEGAELNEEESMVIATSNGRPDYKYGVVSVMPSFEISRDVSAETGNINFGGDIVIKGNVNENMKVTAGGNITIMGNVYQASISCNGNIKIQGHVLGGTVIAGESMVKFLSIIPLLKQLIYIIESMNIEDKNKDTDTGEHIISEHINESVMRAILNRTRNRINHIFDQLDNDVEKLSKKDKGDVVGLINKAKRALVGINAECVNDPSQLLIVTDEINYYIARTETLYDDQSDIYFKYAQNSFIQANGSIFVTDKGTYQCKMLAKDSIVYTGPSSVVRGGNLTAGKRMELVSVGLMSGNPTYCTVTEPGGKIDAKEFNNTVLNIAGELKTIN